MKPDDLQRVVRAAIFPSIGIARVGSSAGEFFLAPEVPDEPASPPGSYRDKTGAFKRQAARFRIYGFDAQGEVVGELLPGGAVKMDWTVHLANTKAAWYQFQIALDIPEAPAAEPAELRNKGIADRESLVIDPGPRTISGCATKDTAFDTGRFLGKAVYLGELRTDEHGRLLVLGGHGKSGSADGKRAVTFANNDGWFDDVSDGPVTAQVAIGGRGIAVDPAWVAVGPPNYAPRQQSVRTLFDLLFAMAVANGGETMPAKPSFSRHIWPMLRRLSHLQWVNGGFAAAFGHGAALDFLSKDLIEDLASAGAASTERRRFIANQFRVFDRDAWSTVPWPWVYGDAMSVPPEKTPRQHAAVSDCQLRFLRQWAEGDFVEDWGRVASPAKIEDVPLAEQPATLTEAALAYCLADAFHPGCELTWPMRHPSMYMAPYRIRHAPGPRKLTYYGSRLTPESALALDGPLHAQSPGDLTRWMAIPWQTDTASCRSGYWAGYGTRFDPLLPTFWPARVPNHVLTEEDYRIVVDPKAAPQARRDAFARRAVWFRQLSPGSYEDQINKLAGDIDVMGIVEEREGVKGDARFPETMQVESLRPGQKDVANKKAGLLMVDSGLSARAWATSVDEATQVEIEPDSVTIGPIDKVRRFRGHND